MRNGHCTACGAATVRGSRNGVELSEHAGQAVGVVRLELLAHSRRLEPLLIGKLCTMTQFLFFAVLLAEAGGFVPFGILHHLAASAVVLTALASLAAYLWFARAGAHATAARV